MLSISINHPDVIDFINAKTDVNKITGANISVRVTDEFMKAAECNEDYILRWPINSDVSTIDINSFKEYNQLYEINGGYYKKIKAREVFTLLCKNNSDYAEPGILYWDRIEKWNTLVYDPLFKYAGVNP